MTNFEIGRAYYATACLEGAGKLVVVPIGRQGRTVQFAAVSELMTGKIHPNMDVGREFATINAEDGKYCVSAACEANAADAAEIFNVIKQTKQGRTNR